jgi:hypothetical protein
MTSQYQPASRALCHPRGRFQTKWSGKSTFITMNIEGVRAYFRIHSGLKTINPISPRAARRRIAVKIG